MGVKFVFYKIFYYIYRGLEKWLSRWFYLPKAVSSNLAPATKLISMKILHLQIKEKWLSKIISGEKTEEIREIRPKNSTKYCEFKENGELIGPIHYDALMLCNGYAKDRASILIEVKESIIELIEDEETGELMTFEENGIEYIESDIIFKLGNILERKNC